MRSEVDLIHRICDFCKQINLEYQSFQKSYMEITLVEHISRLELCALREPAGDLCLCMAKFLEFEHKSGNAVAGPGTTQSCPFWPCLPQCGTRYSAICRCSAWFLRSRTTRFRQARALCTACSTVSGPVWTTSHFS